MATVNEEQFDFTQAMAGIMDTMVTIKEAVTGYRAQLEASGFSPTAAEMMAMELHNGIVRKIWTS